MGMTLTMAPESRDAIVGKIVEQGQAFRAVRQTLTKEDIPRCARLERRSRNVSSWGFQFSVTLVVFF